MAGKHPWTHLLGMWDAEVGLLTPFWSEWRGQVGPGAAEAAQCCPVLLQERSQVSWS